MSIELFKPFLICFILSSFFSCKGQVNPETRQLAAPIDTKVIGKTVSGLYHKIWSVFQDSKGNYWFGSNGQGVYLYDGESLRQFTRADGLLSSAIRGIQEDDKGNIFIETPNGVNKYDGERFTTLKIKRSVMNPWILNESDLWFNCNSEAQHIYRFDGEMLYELKLPKQDIEGKLKVNTADHASSPYSVFGIDKDKKGNLWIGTMLAGAFRFDGKDFLWVGEKELSQLDDSRVPGVRSMLEDKNGHMWLSNFIHKYEVNEAKDPQYKMIKAVDLSEEIKKNKFLYFNSGVADKDGNLWMVSYGGGVWKYDGKELENYEISDGNERVLLISIYQDHGGVLWLGSDNKGVYKYNGETFEKVVLSLK